MRAVRFLVIPILVACSRGERQSAPASIGHAATGPEAPVWQFGVSSTRTDSLPPELKSLADWGDYDEGERPVAYATDINGDGRTDWIVRTDSTVCGPFGGCGIKIFTPGENGAVVEVLDALAQEVLITNKVQNGWPVVWTYVGGIDGGVFRMTFDGREYQQTATLLARRRMTEWTAEQYAADTIWRRLQSVRVP